MAPRGDSSLERSESHCDTCGRSGPKGHACSKPLIEGGRCTGTFRDGTATTHEPSCSWTTCPVCRGTGCLGPHLCVRCNSTGRVSARQDDMHECPHCGYDRCDDGSPTCGCAAMLQKGVEAERARIEAIIEEERAQWRRSAGRADDPVTRRSRQSHYKMLDLLLDRISVREGE